MNLITSRILLYLHDKHDKLRFMKKTFTDRMFLPCGRRCVYIGLKCKSSVLTLAGQAHKHPLSKLYKLKNVVKRTMVSYLGLL